MRAWPLHVVFAAILVGSLAVRDRTTDLIVESGNLEAAVINVARAYGLAFREYTTIGGTDILELVFDAPACTRPVAVVLLSTTLDQERAAQSAREPGYVLSYVYIDRSWDEADRLAIVAQRAKYAVLAVFSLTRYVPSWHLLLVYEPAECKAAINIDWRLAWSRDYLAATEASPR
jgi:hypothetical protein